MQKQLVTCLGVCIGLVVGCGVPTDGVELNGERVVRGSSILLGGSCVDACGAESNNSECWCDDQCGAYGDCFEDYQDQCGERACSPVMCKMHCAFGFERDEDGCEICECADQFCGGVAGFPCPDGYQCVNDPSDSCDPQNGGAYCGGICQPEGQCGDVICGVGEHCELKELQCVTWPCPPLPVCVPGETSCIENSDCTEGEICELIDCSSTDCTPGGICVPAPPSHCFRTGCSAQICADDGVFTSCEIRPEYACYDGATCEAQADGTCGWTMTNELQDCLSNP